MKQRVRFGIKTNSWIFPNAAVFVIHISLENFTKLLGLVEQVKGLIPPEFGGKIICEVS